jgi:hypothetical protein
MRKHDLLVIDVLKILAWRERIVVRLIDALIDAL